jgi:protein-disulfide isomerase
MDASATKAVIEDTVALGDRLGLTGTPAFILGDEVVFGAVGQAALKAKIDAVRKCGKATCSG